MKRHIAVWILIVAVLQPGVLRAQVATLPNTNAAAAAANAVIDTPATPVQIVAGRSTVLDIGAPIMRVSLTNADIADAMVTSASQLLLHGKTPGTISMFVWERAGGVRRYDISVGRDVARLAEQVKQLFKGENIQVSSNGRDVVLSGTVPTKEVAEKVVSLSIGFVEKKEEVVNLLQVQSRPSNQVLLKVRFAEVSRSALTELGISLFTSPTGINNTLGRVTTQQFSAPGYDELNATKTGDDPFKFGAPVSTASGKYTFSDFLNLFILSEKYDLGVLIRALQTRGLFQSLAEPNLVAESGKEASFLAGGEFPDSGGPDRRRQWHHRRVQGVRRPPELHAGGRWRSHSPQGPPGSQHAGLRQRRSVLGLPHPGADQPPHLDRALAAQRADVRDCRTAQQLDDVDHDEDSRHRRHPDSRLSVPQQGGAEEPHRAGRDDHARAAAGRVLRRHERAAAHEGAVPVAAERQGVDRAAAGGVPAVEHGDATSGSRRSRRGATNDGAGWSRAGRP